MSLPTANISGNRVSKLRRMLLVLCMASLALASCESLRKADEKKSEKKPGGPLTLNPPKMRSDQKEEREKWTSIRLPNGTAYAQAKDGMDDVISLSAVESPKTEGVNTIDDVERVVRAENLKFVSFKRGQILGEPVLRYERFNENDDQENEGIRDVLHTSSRRMSVPHMTRTLGAIFLHPSQPGRYVTLTCSRTSHHGQIGDYYQELFEDFISAFVADNTFQSEPYGVIN